MPDALKHIRIHAVLPCTETLGPYRRFAVWVQGCPRLCDGCMTPDARPFDGGYTAGVDRLAEKIAATENIEGLTISGGEPFEQAGALCHLVKRVRKKRDMGVVVYTGYEIETLHGGEREDIEKFLGVIDTLIDGPYVRESDDGLSLRGSANQRAIHLTDRYAKVWDEYFARPGRNVELHLLENEMFLVGIPGPEALEKWRKLAGISHFRTSEPVTK